jgi:anti-sigma-K factor RskA
MEAGIHELTAGYALDALDVDERAAYEAHLSGCEQCQQELATFWETTEALAVAASGRDPSPGLRERILADVRAEPPQNVIPLEPRRRRLAPALGAVAAIAAVVALAIGLWASHLSSQLDDTRSALAREQAAAQVLVDPSAQTVALRAGEGRLVVDSEGQAVLVLDGLDPAPSGKTYEMWIVPAGLGERAPVPAGLFPGSERADIVQVGGTVKAGDVVAVTVESAGGVDSPTLPLVVASDPV